MRKISKETHPDMSCQEKEKSVWQVMMHRITESIWCLSQFSRSRSNELQSFQKCIHACLHIHTNISCMRVTCL